MPSTSKGHARKPDPPDLEHIARTTTRFQKREWAWQRAGWVALALFLIAGFTGVFGAGPLAEVTLRNDSGKFDYQRFVRRHADASWEFTLSGAGAGSGGGGHFEIAIDAAFASNFKIANIQPEPDSARLSSGRWIYRFEVADAGGSLVVFHVQPLHVGRHEGTISVNGAEPFTLWQLTYP